MYATMGNGLYTAFISGLVCFVLVLVLGGYTIYDKVFANHKTFESHKIVTPSIKLHTDGKIIDTIYVYKF